ncbi:YceD family protein [Dictyobacter formicarum]|uniref:DUF177 domain-containing protein n=1 Tax=Dictyobacter formicarum TaxID=2778368 RepID=A0ABQ3VNT8_9CHLR|nr:DUF177 domain-containing protein [Dictyobacter formicarum]GHO87730.1 hypothetical protein KSZ_57360 [Dictyobacter formicarum]
MIFNVAQLMKSPVGSGAAFEADIHEEQVQFDNDFKVIGPIDGHTRMRRVNQGLLVDGWIDLSIELECARCLKLFEQPMHITFEELFYPTVDVVTGTPLPPIDEDDVFPIDEHHQVDLTEAIRQAVLLAIPTVPLCKEDCAGLCARCGHDLNLGPCDCKPEVDDTRLNVLKQLLQNEK